MAKKKLPRPQLRELRHYLEKLPSGRAISKEQFAEILGMGVDNLESIEQGRNHQEASIANHPLMDNLTYYLIEENLLKIKYKEEFIADLTDRVSVVKYLPELISITVPQLQDPILIETIEDITRYFGYRYNEAYVDSWKNREEIKKSLEKDNGNGRVLVHGLGGVGKTTIATKIVEEYVDKDLPVLWIETGDADANSVIKKIRSSNLLKNEIKLAGTLNQAGIKLLVCDNVWNQEMPLELAREIPNGCAFLVTARLKSPASNSISIELKGLDENIALRLLGRSSGGIDFAEHKTAKVLCKKLVYHPQAIVIAGTRIKVDGVSVIEDIIQNIGDYVTHNESDHKATLSDLFKQSFVSPTIPKRHQKLVKSVFKGIGSLFASQAPLQLIQLLPNIEGDVKTLQFILKTYLKDFGMVSETDTLHDTSLYRMHDLVLAVAMDECSPSQLHDGVETCQRYVQQYILRRKFQDIYIAKDNIQGAAEYALYCYGENADNTLFYNLIYPLAFSGYFDAKGYTSRWVELLEIASYMAEGNRLFRDAHYLWTKIGNGFNNLIQFGEATKAYEKALIFAEQIEDGEERIYRESITLCFIGTARGKIGDTILAEKLIFQDAQAKAEGNPNALSQIYEHQGTYVAMKALGYENDEMRRLELFGQAQELLQRAVREGEDAPLPYRDERLFYAYINLGEVKYLLQDYESALESVKNAYDSAVRRDFDDLKARALREIYEKTSMCGKSTEAEEAYEKAKELYQRMDDQFGERRLYQLKLNFQNHA